MPHNAVLDVMKSRRSIRRYLDEPVPDEKIGKILEAGLLAPSSRSRRPWELIIVRDPVMLEKLSQCRAHGSEMLKDAKAAIVVVADTSKSDVCIEDCSIVMAHMMLLAEALGVGSCWIQIRLRTTEEKQASCEYLRQLLKFPASFKAEAILSIGIPDEHPAPRTLEELPLEKLHQEIF